MTGVNEVYACSLTLYVCLSIYVRLSLFFLTAPNHVMALVCVCCTAQQLSSYHVYCHSDCHYTVPASLFGDGSGLMLGFRSDVG